MLPVLDRVDQSLPGLDIKPSLVPDLLLNLAPARGRPSPQDHPALTEVTHLPKGEFPLGGYLDSGHEDVAVGT